MALGDFAIVLRYSLKNIFKKFSAKFFPVLARKRSYLPL